MTAKVLNPLRYPGSKFDFIDEFSDYVKRNNLEGKQIVEPYAGSASISLGLLQNNLVSSAILIERDPLIFSFWHCVFSRTEELICQIENLDVSLDTWFSMEPYKKIDGELPEDLLPLGLAGLFFNRTNFSGVMHAGPIGGKLQVSQYTVDCRFNKKDIIKRIKKVSELADRVSIFFGDAVKALKDANHSDNSQRFFYIDPPYYKQGQKLYRYHYKLRDHQALSEALTEADYPWILSYDHHHVIEHFYADFLKISRNFRYSSRSPKKEKELLITNIQNWNHAPETEQSCGAIPPSSNCQINSLVTA